MKDKPEGQERVNPGQMKRPHLLRHPVKRLWNIRKKRIS